MGGRVLSLFMVFLRKDTWPGVLGGMCRAGPDLVLSVPYGRSLEAISAVSCVVSQCLLPLGPPLLLTALQSRLNVQPSPRCQQKLSQCHRDDSRRGLGEGGSRAYWPDCSGEWLLATGQGCS